MNEPTEPTRAKVTAEQLAEWLQLDTDRKAKQREVDAAKASQDALAAQIASALETSGHAECKRGKLRAAFVQVAGRVSWKAVAATLLRPDQMAEEVDNVPTKRKLVIQAITSLLLCLCLVGCIKSDAPAGEEFTSFENEWNEPADWNQSAEAAAEPVEAAAELPTGVCVVYTAPDYCEPCRWLGEDLEWLTTKGWTVSTDPATPADFLILPRRDESQVIPYLEYWHAGEKINTHLGYSSSPDWKVRKLELASILQKHPRRKR